MNYINEPHVPFHEYKSLENDLEKFRDSNNRLLNKLITLEKELLAAKKYSNERWSLLRSAYDKLEATITDVVSQEFDQLCWLDVYVKLGELIGKTFEPKLLSTEQFLNNCKHFEQCMRKTKTLEEAEKLYHLETNIQRIIDKIKTRSMPIGFIAEELEKALND